VAYADFVTALMALFIVLWMMNATDRVKRSVSGYFLDPRGYTRKLGAGPAHSGEGLKVEKRTLGEVRQQIEAALERMPDFARLRRNVQLSVTGEGLRIDLVETEQGLFFPSGSTQPTPAGERLLAGLAAEKAIPTPAPFATGARIPPTATGSSPSSAPTSPAVSCTLTACGPSRLWKCAALPISTCCGPTRPTIPPTAASPWW
jgi:hypothetical protein